MFKTYLILQELKESSIHRFSPQVDEVMPGRIQEPGTALGLPQVWQKYGRFMGPPVSSLYARQGAQSEREAPGTKSSPMK